MSACCGFRAQPRWKKRCIAIFPKGVEDPVLLAELGRLVNYAGVNTDKLPKIGRYLVKRLRKSLKKRRFKQAVNAAFAMNAVVRSCHRDIALFYPSLERCMRLLLDAPGDGLRLAAVELFVTFADKAGEEASTLQWDVVAFVESFVEMALGQAAVGGPGAEVIAPPLDAAGGDRDAGSSTTGAGGASSSAAAGAGGASPPGEPSAAAQQNVRLGGLRALRAFFALTDESSKWTVEMSKVLPAIVTNLRRSNVAEPVAAVWPNVLRVETSAEWRQWTVAKVAAACMRDVGSRVTVSTVPTLVRLLAAHLDEAGLWLDQDGEFAVEVMRTFVAPLKPQDNQAAVDQLLAHLEKQTDARVKRQILLTVLAVLRSSILTIHALSRALLAELADSFDRLHRHHHHHEQATAETELQAGVVRCFGAVASRVKPAQQCDALAQMVDAFPPPSSRRLRAALLRCMCAVAGVMRRVPRGREPVVGEALAACLACLDADPTAVGPGDGTIRPLALRAMLALLRPLDAGDGAAGSSKGGARANPLRRRSRAATSLAGMDDEQPQDGRMWIDRHREFVGPLLEQLLLAPSAVAPTSKQQQHEAEANRAIGPTIGTAIHLPVERAAPRVRVDGSVLILLQTQLYRYGADELLRALPVVFELQQLAATLTEFPTVKPPVTKPTGRSKKGHKGESAAAAATAAATAAKLSASFSDESPDVARSAAHELVAAYLLYVARAFQCAGLEQYVQQVLHERTADRQGCNVLRLAETSAEEAKALAEAAVAAATTAAAAITATVGGGASPSKPSKKKAKANRLPAPVVVPGLNEVQFIKLVARVPPPKAGTPIKGKSKKGKRGAAKAAAPDDDGADLAVPTHLFDRDVVIEMLSQSAVACDDLCLGEANFAALEWHIQRAFGLAPPPGALVAPSGLDQRSSASTSLDGGEDGGSQSAKASGEGGLAVPLASADSSGRSKKGRSDDEQVSTARRSTAFNALLRDSTVGMPQSPTAAGSSADNEYQPLAATGGKAPPRLASASQVAGRYPYNVVAWAAEAESARQDRLRLQLGTQPADFLQAFADGLANGPQPPAGRAAASSSSRGSLQPSSKSGRHRKSRGSSGGASPRDSPAAATRHHHHHHHQAHGHAAQSRAGGALSFGSKTVSYQQRGASEHGEFTDALEHAAATHFVHDDLLVALTAKLPTKLPVLVHRNVPSLAEDYEARLVY